MGFLGMGKGLAKIGMGLMDGDIVKVGKGVLQTAGNALGTLVVGPLVQESVGDMISKGTNTLIDGEDDGD